MNAIILTPPQQAALEALFRVQETAKAGIEGTCRLIMQDRGVNPACWTGQIVTTEDGVLALPVKETDG